MKFNSTGLALTGIGGAVGRVAVDGVVPAALGTMAGGGWGWLTDDIIAGPGDFGSGYLLRSYTISTLTVADLDPGVGDVNVFKAGNNVWAAFLAGTGVWTSVAGLGPFPASSLADISPGGDIVLISVYQADRGVVVYNAGGSQTANRDVVLTLPSIHARTGIVSYQTAASWQLMTTAGVSVGYAPRTDATVVSIVPCQVGSTVWVLEWAVGDTLTLRPAASGQGYTIASGVDNIFNPDICDLSGGVVRVGWSTTTGEAHTDLRLMDLTLASGANTVATSAGGAGIVTTTGSPLSPAVFPVGAVVGGGGQGLLKSLAALYQHPLVEPSRLVTAIWYKNWFQSVSRALTTPIDLASQTTGILGPGQGGTGTDTGTSVLNGANLIDGSVPLTAIEDQTSSTLLGRGEGDGAGPPQVITLGTGLLMTGTVLSASGGDGYWVPLTDGDPVETELIFAAGECVMVFVPV